MKKLVQVQDVEGEGLVALLGQNVLLFCLNYFYAGKLIGVNETCVLLEDACIVYETGELCGTTFKDAQKLPASTYVQISHIEAFCVSGR